MTIDQLKCGLEHAGITFSPGLNSSELRAIEAHYGFDFPPDLRSFLAYAMPTGDRFPDWRSIGSQSLADTLAWPFEGIWFDVKKNSLWLTEWGPKPADDNGARARLRELFDAAPKLVPIYGHRYMPCRPNESGNPVFSVYQSDIICYGLNLEDYFQNEYCVAFGRSRYQLSGNPKPIEFWSSFID